LGSNSAGVKEGEESFVHEAVKSTKPNIKIFFIFCVLNQN